MALRTYRKTVIMGAAGVLALTGVAPLAAQPAAESASEEIVVVARRREESLQKVPIAITVLSNEELNKRNIRGVNDLQYAVPSLKIGGQKRSESQITLRGQGPGAIQNGNRLQPGAVIYVAEVPTSLQGPGGFYDMQSVQVLKGPQGTLFGRNTTGGAVLLVPTKPGNEFGGYIRGQYGNYNDREIEGAVDIPIVKDILKIRLAGTFAQREGFTENVFNGQELDDRNYRGGRLGISFTPSDRFENYLLLDYLNINQNGTSSILTRSYTFGGVAGAQAVVAQNALGVRKINQNFFARDDQHNWGATNITTFEVTDNLTLKNVIGYRLNQAVTNNNHSGATAFVNSLSINNRETDGYNTNLQQWTEEAQIQGKSFGDRLQWILGTYWEYFDAGPGDQRTTGNNNTVRTSITPKDTSHSFFGEGTFDLSELWQGLKFTAGYRYTWDKRSAVFLSCAAAAYRCSVVTGRSAVSANFSAPSWNFTLAKEFGENLTVYFSERKSYKAGSFILPPVAGFSAQVGPEEVEEQEIGLKSRFDLLDRPGFLNVAAFHDYYQGRQVFVVSAASAVPGVRSSVYVNGLPEDNYGVEIEAGYSPVQGLNLSGFWSYQHIPAGIGIYASEQATEVPKVKYGISASYLMPFVPETWGDVTIRTDWYWQAHYQYGGTLEVNPLPGPYGTGVGGPFKDSIYNDSYGLLNLRLDWDNIAGSDVSAALFATKVLDEEYVTSEYTISPLFDSKLYGDPRMYGFQLTYKFGAAAGH